MVRYEAGRVYEFFLNLLNVSIGLRPIIHFVLCL
jgi:hypothetical protein